MNGWKKIMSLGDKYKAEIKRLQLLKNGIEAMVQEKTKQQEAVRLAMPGADLYVKEGQYEIANILLFENDDDN
ncbi:MAG: hypothetical protein IPQ10_02780 [Saprospiraceae bacterium]|jgi:hypothetical protein|nr:hypothetical protein [Saprospiraceae bacterium]MBK7796615.1 hypothetical protein [Saprospiraceae bacterium]MBK8152672.1 hypothetical protein [Saprospiraceae bacterium]MBK9378775.1 hypothetical protein [Saprospiraceae bacterium]MBL0259995.1 hypothetical protein [Saprospiraceae bacterium]